MIHSNLSNLTRFNFCPGNVGSYDLLFGRIPRYVQETKTPEIASGNDTEGGFLLVWLNKGGSGGCAFRFDGGMNKPCAGYLMEKMSIGLLGDANALLGFLRTQGIETHIDGDKWTDCGQYMPGGGASQFDEACKVVGIISRISLCECNEPERETRDGGRTVVCTICGKNA